jgi:protein-S-isoprenylcysteine O-methyltransferase Ste14
MYRVLFIVIGITSTYLAITAFAHLGWFLLYMDGDGEFKTINVIIDLGLLIFFGIQHSLMASNPFKDRVIKLIPRHLERAIYIIISSLSLLIVIFLWKPLPKVIFLFNYPFYQIVIGLYIGGWLLSLYSLLAIDPFELFGLKQIYYFLLGKDMPPIPFTEKGIYKYVRHPIYLSTLIIFWITPRMTFGHLLLSITWSIYVIIGATLEERRLIKEFGAQYEDYKRRVPMLFPPVLRFSKNWQKITIF